MAFDGHWRKVGTVVGVYLVGLIGVQQWFYWQEDPEQTAYRTQYASTEAKRWDDAKEAGQPTNTHERASERALPVWP